jgi:hypothetical protein
MMTTLGNNYIPTQVAGKFPAEFGGQCRRFWRVSSLDAKIAPLVKWVAK